MTIREQVDAWIFVSHASTDLANVRKVRNYLELKGAAPLLFHLRALTDPEEFWPLIEREIVARNFFLYCESDAAEQSEWVRRERDAVARAAVSSPKRIGAVDVGGTDVEMSQLDAFLSKTRVFPSFSHRDRDRVLPFLRVLASVGFQVFDDLEQIKPATDWKLQLQAELMQAAENGWVVAFLSNFSMTSQFVQAEISMALQLGAKFVPVLIDQIPAHQLPPALASIQCIHAADDPVSAAAILANELLQRT